LVRDQEAAGSNPVAPTTSKSDLPPGEGKVDGRKTRGSLASMPKGFLIAGAAT